MLYGGVWLGPRRGEGGYFFLINLYLYWKIISYMTGILNSSSL